MEESIKKLLQEIDEAKKDVKSLIEKMEVSSLIEGLPDGLDTETNDDDETISEGMRQIIGLARAIIKKPRILILDEALSAVDSETETRVRQNIFNIIKDATVLIIAHRLNMTEDIDQIVVMKDGSVVETGNYTQLIEAKGEYYRLITSQKEGKEI